MMIDVMLLSGCLTSPSSEPPAKLPAYLTIFTSSFFFLRAISSFLSLVVFILELAGPVFVFHVTPFIFDF